MTVLRQTILGVLERAGPMENRDATCDELVKALGFPHAVAYEPTRYELDMDGSMEPHPEGQWVRYQDIS